MSHSIIVAAVQLDAALSLVNARLARAEAYIAQAAEQGAQLVVLPAQFATGAGYDDVLYERTEAEDEQIVTWMKAQASQHNVYLVGSLLLWDVDEVYHAALLISPDGAVWRWDQQFPYMWERSLYRDGHEQVHIAETALGRVGILLGWDAAHPALWRRYAANVDLMLVLHSAPDWAKMQLVTPDGAYQMAKIGLGAFLGDHAAYVDEAALEAKGMGVPLIIAGGAGTFESLLPAPRQSIAVLAMFHKGLLSFIRSAHQMHLRAPFVRHTAIYDAQGRLVHRAASTSDDVVVGEIKIASLSPHSQGHPPAHIVALPDLMAVDAVSSAWMAPIYQRGVRRQWGARMAPASHKTRIWVWAIIFISIVFFLIGRQWRRCNARSASCV